MLTKQQLQRIAQRHGIGLQAQERDYIQHLFLSVLYGRNQGLLFKGGTALIRAKARDLYDLWFLTEQGLSVDVALIDAKLALYDAVFERERFQQQVEAQDVPKLRKFIQTRLAQETSRGRDGVIVLLAAHVFNRCSAGPSR